MASQATNWCLVHFNGNGTQKDTFMVIQDTKNLLKNQTKAKCLDPATDKWCLGDIIYRGIITCLKSLKAFKLNVNKK